MIIVVTVINANTTIVSDMISVVIVTLIINHTDESDSYNGDAEGGNGRSDMNNATLETVMMLVAMVVVLVMTLI